MEKGMIRGMDVSSYLEMKDNGYRYFDETGEEVDVLEYAVKRGFNYARLRLWNEPQNEPESGGYCDLAQTIIIAKKIKALGMGIEGTVKEDRGYIRMNVDYRSQSYEDDFQVVDLSQAFGMIKQEYGINLHGILGSTFFQKYRYVLNFDELVAYSMV